MPQTLTLDDQDVALPAAPKIATLDDNDVSLPQAAAPAQGQPAALPQPEQQQAQPPTLHQEDVAGAAGPLPGVPRPQVDMTVPSIGETVTGQSNPKTAKPTQMYDYGGKGTEETESGIEQLAQAWGKDQSFNSKDAKQGLTKTIDGIMSAGGSSMIGAASPMALRALAASVAGGYVTGEAAKRITKGLGLDPDTQDLARALGNLAGGVVGGGVAGYHNGEGVRPEYQAPPEPEEPSVEVPEEKALPAPKPEPVTHPAGKVTGIDSESGLPIVDRSQPTELKVKGEELPPQTGEAGKMSPEAEKVSAAAAKEAEAEIKPSAKAQKPAAKEPAAEAKGETATPEPKALPAPKEEEPVVGEKEPESGRMVLQPTDSAEQNQKLATAGLKQILPSIKQGVEEVPGAEMAGVRAEKDTERTQEKIEDEKKPASTVPDYSALRISVDSPQAKDETVAALRDQLPVVREKDEFEKGSPGEQFHAHMLQVQSPNGATHEIQVLPKEVADIAEKTHPLYEKAREGDKDAQKELKTQNAAAMEEFNARNASQKRAPETQAPLGPQKVNEPSSNKIDKLQRGAHVVLPDGRSAKVDYHDHGRTGRARVTTEDGTKIDSVAGKDLVPLKPAPLNEGQPWIAFDLDKTLAKYNGFKGPLDIGKPIGGEVAEALKKHLAAGDNVRILTARVNKDPDGKIARQIQAWTQHNFGKALPVTDQKDQHMVKLYDDRAVPVEPNTGKILGGGEEAEEPAKPAELAKPEKPEPAKELAKQPEAKPEVAKEKLDELDAKRAEQDALKNALLEARDNYSAFKPESVDAFHKALKDFQMSRPAGMRNFLREQMGEATKPGDLADIDELERMFGMEERHGGLGAVNPANLVPDALRDYLAREAALVAKSREIHGGLYDLAEQYDADVLRAGKLLKSLPGTPADEEAAYHHQENPKQRLTAKQQAILDKLAPFDKEAEKIYQKLNPDKQLTANYVHRIAQQKGSLLDRVLNGSKSTGKGNVLKKSASASKKRSMMAIESANGKTREVVSVARGRVTEWHDGIPRDLGALRSGLTTREDILDERLEPLEREEKKLKAEQRTLNETKSRQAAAGRRLQNIANRLQQIEADKAAIEHEHVADNLPDKGWRDKDGRVWTFKNATTKEIEAHTPIKYYKNAAASTVTNWLELRKAERAFDYIEKLKNDPEFNDLAIKPKNPGQIPEGWKSTQLPQLMGYYFEPHIAEVFDHYAKQLAQGAPGILQQVGDFLTTSIFLNPIAHLPNLTANWLAEKGVAIANPFAWGKEFKAGVKAFSAVTHKNQDFIEALDAGAPLQSQKIVVHQFADLLVKKLQEEAGERGVLEKLQGALGSIVNVPGAVKAVVDFIANKTTFPVHDIYLLQSAYLKMEEGMGLTQALQDTAKYIPNERLPTRIFNSKAIADLMANPALTMFSRYHYGVLKGWGQILKNVSGTGFKEEGTNAKGEPVNKAGRTSDEEKMHALNIAAGLAIMMAVIYPALDQLAKKETGNKDARVRRPGYSTFADAAARAYRGDITWQQAARTAVTPAIGTETALDLAVNRDLMGTGRKIYDPHASGKVIAGQVGRRLAESVSPAQLALRASQSREDTKKMLYGLIGISFPKQGALHLAAELNADRMGNTIESPKERERAILLSEARYSAWQGDKSAIGEAQKSGKFTPHEIFLLQMAASEKPLIYETRGMGIEDVMKVFDRATPEEKKTLLPVLERKEHLIFAIKDKDERESVFQKFKQEFKPYLAK